MEENRKTGWEDSSEGRDGDEEDGDGGGPRTLPIVAHLRSDAVAAQRESAPNQLIGRRSKKTQPGPGERGGEGALASGQTGWCKNEDLGLQT